MARVEIPSRLRARKRRRRIIFAGMGAVALLVLMGALVWLSWAPFLRVETIKVSGAQTIATSSIEAAVAKDLSGAYLFMFARNNILLYPRTGIEAHLLAEYPTFSRVEVHVADFHTVAVEVSERQPVALWCPIAGQPGECSYMDEQGMVYAPAPQFSEAPYVTYSGALATTSHTGLRQYLTPGQFQSLRALVDALDQKEPQDPIGQVVVDANGDARAYFHDDFLLIFSTKDDGGDIFRRFELALQADPFKDKQLSAFEYLDLRFGDKLYYKAK